MKQFLSTVKDPLTNTPSCYYNFITTGFYTPNPAETNVKKLIDPITVTGANFPQDTPTRFLINIPGVPDYSGAFDPTSGRTWSVKVYRPSTAAFTVFTLVAQSVTLGANQCKIFNGTTENCAVMEFHNGSIAVDDMVYIDGYFINTIMNVGEANSMIKGVTTVVIASSDSYVNSKINADHIIDTSDDAGAKINIIITALNTSGYGGIIKFLEGTYNVKTQITLQSNITISGIYGGVTFNRAANIDSVFYASGENNIIIENVIINGVKATYTTGTKNGIYFLNCSFCHIKKSTIKNNNEIGILCITSSGKEFVYIKDNVIFGNTDDNIYFSAYNNIYIENNKLYSSIDSIYLTSVTTFFIKKNLIFSNTQYGINIDTSCTGGDIINNDISSNTTANICLNTSSFNKISLNYLAISADGLWILGTSADNIINNNIIYSNTDTGIKISGGDNNSIFGNKSTSNNYGIHLLTGATGNIIQGNVLDINTTDSILFDSGATINYAMYNKAADITDDDLTLSNTKTENY